MEGRLQREQCIERQTLDFIGRQKETYLEEFFRRMVNKSMTTREKYIRYVVEFIDFCKQHFEADVLSIDIIRQIDLTLMNQYILQISIKQDGSMKKNAPTIVNAKISAVSAFFKFWISKGVLTQNLCDLVERLRVPEQDNLVYLEQDEINEVMQNIANGVGSSIAKQRQTTWMLRDKLLIMLPLVTGIRISALLDINVGDINVELGILQVVEKEEKTRSFEIQGLMECIQEWLDQRELIVNARGGENEALFITVYGGQCKRMTATAANKIITKYTASTHKPITAHKLRATMATSLYDATGDIYLVSTLLGHNSTEVTRRYAKVKEDKKRNALNYMSAVVSGKG